MKTYAEATGLDAEIPELLGPHAMRATVATNALDHEADIVEVQRMLGHADISVTRGYDRRHAKPAKSPVFRVRY